MPETRLGLNATLTTVKQGTFTFRCESLTHGIDIVYSETQGRVQNSFNPIYVTEQAFSVTAVCVGYAEYNALMNWVEIYKNSNTTTGGTGPTWVRVTVPSRGFDRVGILSTGGVRGDKVGDYSWHLPLSFESTLNPLDVNSSAGKSHFIASPVDYTDEPYFYPSSYSTDPIPIGVEASLNGKTPVAGGQDNNGITTLLNTLLNNLITFNLNNPGL